MNEASSTTAAPSEASTLVSPQCETPFEVVAALVRPYTRAARPTVAVIAPGRSNRLIFRNLGNGKFEELMDAAGPGVEALHSSRGCAFGDFDNDGDLDILIVNLNEPPSLLRNDLGGDYRWLKVKLVGTKSNRSA